MGVAPPKVIASSSELRAHVLGVLLVAHDLFHLLISLAFEERTPGAPTEP